MSYSTLSPSSLRYANPGHTDWNTDVFIYNIERLNDTLLKISGLLDVDLSGITNGDIISYNTVTSKWEPDTFPGTGRWLSTTTTTSSSSSTSTQSSTSSSTQ